jgi:hypothetical protein
MTNDELIRMAREAGLGSTMTHHGGEPRVWIEGADWHDELARFAALVAAAERDACAKLVDAESRKCLGERERYAVDDAAAAIRERGQE